MLIFRPLIESDVPKVETMDALSGNSVVEWLDTEGAFGAFRGEELVGYLTMGYADDCGNTIETHTWWNHDARLLSDVYVKSECRGQGIGLKLIQYVLGLDDFIGENPVYLSVIYDGLMDYYQKLRFEHIGEHHMAWKAKKEGLA